MSEESKSIYEKTLQLLERYFQKKDWKKLFLCGGCYWFANYLDKQIPNSYLVINRFEEHCAICIDGKIYDVRGEISSNGFYKVTDREISFMKKNYKPKFCVSQLETYLSQSI